MNPVIRDILGAAGSERLATAEVLKLIVEVQKRRLYSDEGYSSLYAFLTLGAKYSEGAAMRRIQAAKVVARDRSVLEKIKSGELSLCALAELGKVTREEKLPELLEKASNCSKREVERLVATVLPPRVIPRESIRLVMVRNLPPPATVTDGLFAACSLRSSADTKTFAIDSRVNQSPPPVAVVTQKESSTELCHEVRFLADREIMSLLTEARTYSGNCSVAELVKLGLKALIQKKRPRAKSARKFNTAKRRIPKHVREAVLTRANRKCEYVSSSGKRCEERAGLQIDHVTPYAKGGRTEPANLRALCGCHNRLMAERSFGKAFMENKIQERRQCGENPSKR